MKIEFFNKEDGSLLANTDYSYFVMNDMVYKDNEATYESQCATVSFDDCIVRMPKIGWRVVDV